MNNKRILNRIKRIEQRPESSQILERVYEIDTEIEVLQNKIQELKQEQVKLLGLKPYGTSIHPYFQSHPEHIGNVLSCRLANALNRYARIQTISQLRECIDTHGLEYLLRFRNIGEKGLREIERKLGI